MKRAHSLVLSLLLIAASAAASESSLGPIADQAPVAPTDESPLVFRSLVNDGSFENGECDYGSSWTCTSNTYCTWILDPLPIWGYPAYDGTYAAWLGGSCNGVPNSNSFCQDVWLGGCTGPFIEWRWMGYVENNDGNTMRVTVDGAVVFTKVMTTADHTYGTWGTLWAYSGDGWPGTHTLCFEFEATTGANMLIDYVLTGFSPTAVGPTSFSAVKSLY